MNKKREHDPELEKLLQAFREVHPTVAERNQWRAAIANEIKELSAPPAQPLPRATLYRLFIRVALPTAVAASLGFIIGAYFVERRYDQGQAMLFSQNESSETTSHRPTTMDETREVIRINLDSGVRHE